MGWKDDPIVDAPAQQSWKDDPIVDAPAQQSWQDDPIVEGTDAGARLRVRKMRADAGLNPIDRTPDEIQARQQYLRDKYVTGLIHPLAGIRKTYSENAIKEVTDPTERQFLVGEVARVAQAQEQNQIQNYNQSSYIRRWASNQAKVNEAFANAGTGMVEALKGLVKPTAGKPEDIQFNRAMESARQGGNPFANEAPGFSGRVATGLAGMTPDVAGGVLAGMAGGPPATVGYWAARQYPERREDYAALGLGPNASAAAGGASAFAESALWALDRDPTGLSKGLVAPVQGLVRKGVSKITSETAKRAATLGLEAAAHTGLGTLRTAGQAVVREGGKALAGSGESASDVLVGAVEEAKQAAPLLAVMAGVGAGSKAPGAFAETKRATIRNEILGVAAAGETPTREQWTKRWGFPPEEGRSRAARKEAVRKIADTYHTVEQLQVVAADAAPTEEQWKRWGLPTEEGNTKESRRAFVQQRFTPRAPEAEASELADKVSAAPELSQVHPEAVQQALQSAPEAAPEAAQQALGPAPMHHDFPVEMEGTGQRIGGREVVRELEQIWDVPIRSGRIGSSEPRAIYKLRSMVSRLAKGEESSIAVAVHEAIGHHLDNTTDVLKNAPQDIRKEVGRLDYDTERGAPVEGFAEFLRAYLTGATERFKAGVDLKIQSPKFLAYFDQWLSEHPDVKAKIEASRTPINAFIKAGAVGRVKGQISKTGIDTEHPDSLRERLHEWGEFLYTRLKEEGRPIQRFIKEAKSRGYNPGTGTTPFEDYNALRQAGPHLAQRAIEDGVFKLTGQQEKIGPSLVEALSEIAPPTAMEKLRGKHSADYENFIAWAYSRHAIESWSKGKNPGGTLEDFQETVKQLYDPRYERAADKLTQFANATIDLLVDVGAIDAREGKSIKGYYLTYLPLLRAKGGSLGGGGGRRMVDLSAAVKGRWGNGLQIKDPVESLVSLAIRRYERASQQIVTNKLIEVANGVEGLGGWAEMVPAKVMATKFSIEEIKKQLPESVAAHIGADPMLDIDAIDPMTALIIWRPDLAKVHGVPIVRVVVEGKPRFIQVHPELAEALGGMDTLQHLGLATRTARFFTGWLKIGATRWNPDFILKNAFRDLDTFIMQGEKGLVGAFDPAKYAAAYIMTELQKARGQKGDPVVELWQKMGGELSTYAGLDRARLQASVKRALAGKQGKMETTMNIAGLTEVGPRVAEFSAILQKEGWLDRVRAGETPPMEVLTRAINAAHDVTVDFRRMGSWGRYINYWIPFFNARLEGTDKFVRTWKDNPARSALRAGQWIATRAMLYWWWRHNDDDYKERPAWQDGFFVLKDAQGNPTIRISKSQEWGVIECGVERMMDSMYDKDPEAMTRWFKQVAGAVNPMGLPSGVTPAFESLVNYDTFRGRSIVSDTIGKNEAPDQYYEYTSNIAKAVSRKLFDISNKKVGLSPAQIDHLANGLTGGLYNTITSTTEKGVALFQGEPVGIGDIPGLKGLALRKDYAKSVDDFYTQKTAIEKAQNSKNLREPVGERDLYAEDLRVFRKMKNVATLMTEIRDTARNLPAADRDQADLIMTGLARAALGREPLARYPNPLVDPSVAPDAIQAVVRKHIAQHAITASASSPASDMRASAAIKYLLDMGVSLSMAQDLAYARLRSQGVKDDTATNRVKWLGNPGQ